jgi:hypothetical protein
MRSKPDIYLNSTIKQSKWQGFGVAKCTKKAKWPPISINSFSGSEPQKA